MNWRNSRRGSLSAAAVLLLAGAAAMAQMGGSGGAPTAPAQQPMPGQTGASGSAMPETDANSAQSAAKYTDGSFVEDTLKTDNAQVAMSQLAQQKSASDDVKQFGQKMIEAHTALDNQLKPLAKQLEISQPKEPAKKEKQEIAKLEALSGPQFDAEYIQAMAHEQQHSLKAFHDEAKQNDNTAAEQAAKMDEPVLSQHLQILEKLAEAHNVAIEDTTAKK